MYGSNPFYTTHTEVAITLWLDAIHIVIRLSRTTPLATSSCCGWWRRNCLLSACRFSFLSRWLTILDLSSDLQSTGCSMVSLDITRLHAYSLSKDTVDVDSCSVRDLALQLLREELQHMDIPDQRGESGTPIGKIDYTLSRSDTLLIHSDTALASSYS